MDPLILDVLTRVININYPSESSLGWFFFLEGTLNTGPSGGSRNINTVPAGALTDQFWVGWVSPENIVAISENTNPDVVVTGEPTVTPSTLIYETYELVFREFVPTNTEEGTAGEDTETSYTIGLQSRATVLEPVEYTWYMVTESGAHLTVGYGAPFHFEPDEGAPSAGSVLIDWSGVTAEINGVPHVPDRFVVSAVRPLNYTYSDIAGPSSLIRAFHLHVTLKPA